MAIQHQPSFSEIFGDLFSTVPEKAGAIVSVGMIATPLWMQYVESVSQVAALLAPILGCIYLSLQIGFKLWDRTRDDE